MDKKLYLEDIHPGQVFGSPRYLVTAEEIVDFAGQWDPQVFHLDGDAARDTFFEGLAASGWHTGAITMRLLVTGEFQPAGGIIGAGIEELKWFRPVRPDDVLSIRTEILESRPMKSKPGFGLCRVKVTTLDGQGEPVQAFTSPLVVPMRP
ncbi:MAG TPA: MaoC family dehydratase [Candidatus Omnitrophota bacterium]|nr:MaoC family dehydratase [Candidatus Omnitrophota bacterium]